MKFLQIIVGFLFFILGLGYLFNPPLILQMNAFIREYVVRDSVVLLRHRRVGLLLLFLSFILIALTLLSPR